MNKFFLSATAFALASCLIGCSSEPAPVLSQAFAPQGKNVYLRGEMNDYAVMSSYLLTAREDGSYCALAPLRADWSPYRFKFASADWAAGSNFGFANPPGVLREGSAPLELNPNSRFEELRFYPKQDGIYRFCIRQDDEGRYFATVQRAGDDELSLIDAIFRQGSAATPAPVPEDSAD